MKRLLVLLLAVVMIVSLAACGGKPSTGTGTNETGKTETGTTGGGNEKAPSSGEKVKVVLWGLNPLQVGAGNKEMIDAFNKAHPNIELVPQTTPGTGGYATQDMTKLLAAIAGGTPPDVTWIDRFTVGEYASRGALMPLDEFIDKSGLDMSQYAEYTQREATFENKVYALPWDTDTRMLMWNKDLFQKAGLDPDKAPTTWEETLNYAKKLTQTDAKGNFKTIGFIALFGNGELYNYAYSDHQKLLSDDGRKCLLNSPGIVKAMEFVLKSYDQLGGAKKVNAYTSTFQGDANDPFLTGQVAMLVNGNWALNSYARYKPDLKYGVDLIPNSTGNDRGTWSGGWSWAIPKGAKQAEAGFEVIKWLTTEGFKYQMEGQAAFNKKQGTPFIPGMPAYKPADEELVKTYIDTLPDGLLKTNSKFARDIISVSTCREVSPVAETSYAELRKAEDKVIYHELSPQEALNEATKNTQAALDKFWADYDANKK